MPSIPTLFLAMPLVACTLWILFGLGSVLWVTRRPRREMSATLPPVTVLKPLAGRDSGLLKNLESFFHQDHPDYEIVLGVEDPEDPAVDVARYLMRRHPNVPAKLVVRGGGSGTNPKVRNLLGMLPQARHDLLLVSDSNIRAPAHYVREMAALFATEREAGVVTNLFAGTGEESLGGALECVQLNGFCAGGMALPTVFGDPALTGKSMLFSRRVLDEFGGLERTRHLLAEDYILGKLFQHAGYKVLLAPTVLHNHVGKLGFAAFLGRHLRWSMLRWRLRPSYCLLEVLTSPLVLLPLGLLVLGVWALPWAAALLALRDAGGWVVLRGSRGLWRPLLLAPVRDFLMLLLWIIAPLKRHISWRGHRVRLAMGTLLFEERSRSG
jgi:ceramide glucosyltransferase